MQEAAVRTIMIALAVITPVVGLLVLLLGRWAETLDGKAMTRQMRRNVWILILAGPVNLAAWFAFNGLLEGVGSRSVIGYVLAAVVFIAAGFGTGYFSRRRGRSAEQKSGPERIPPKTNHDE
jgi:hypothetical protein